MATTVSEMQQHLMKLFAFNKTEKSVEELKKVLFDYYNQQLDSQLDNFWRDNNMTKQKLAADSAQHIRTPYK
ncbi:MAG: hypothetical protein ACI30H_04110 [Paludibacteraceae bacterium]